MACFCEWCGRPARHRLCAKCRDLHITLYYPDIPLTDEYLIAVGNSPTQSISKGRTYRHLVEPTPDDDEED